MGHGRKELPKLPLYQLCTIEVAHRAPFPFAPSLVKSLLPLRHPCQSPASPLKPAPTSLSRGHLLLLVSLQRRAHSQAGQYLLWSQPAWIQIPARLLLAV